MIKRIFRALESLINVFKKSTVEIERKFLIDTTSYYDRWSSVGKTPIRIVQGYLNSDPTRVVRIRVSDRKGYLTVKGQINSITRSEHEYEIPVCDAISLLDMCEKPLIIKDRYTEVHDGLKWEIDIFKGENEGLAVAEIELKSENQKIILPGWVRDEVSHDKRYFNSNLLKNPYKNWSK